MGTNGHMILWKRASIFIHLCIQSFVYLLTRLSISLVAQMVNCLSTMRETWVWSLGGEDLLEKEMATHSSILVQKIPRMEEPGRLQSMGSQRVRHYWATNTFTFTFSIYSTVFIWVSSLPGTMHWLNETSNSCLHGLYCHRQSSAYKANMVLALKM